MVRRLLALALFASGCSQADKPLTQLMLVSDTDALDIDQIQFVVAAASHASETASATHAPGGGPADLSVVHDEGPLGPLTVTARGLHGSTLLLERTQQVSFVKDETRVVPLHLYARCIGVTCPADQTCAEQGCAPQLLDPSVLPTWTGAPPRLVDLDASAPDAAFIVDGGQTRDGGETADDGGQTDDGGDAEAGDASASDAAMTRLAACTANGGDGGLYDLLSDPVHCGRCNHSCKMDVEQCVAGNCVKK